MNRRIFERKIYDKMLNWKKESAGKTALLIEGARRVGKSTIAEEFAKKNYRSYLKIDFANINGDLLSAFDDIAKLDIFLIFIKHSFLSIPFSTNSLTSSIM